MEFERLLPPVMDDMIDDEIPEGAVSRPLEVDLPSPLERSVLHHRLVRHALEGGYRRRHSFIEGRQHVVEGFERGR